MRYLGQQREPRIKRLVVFVVFVTTHEQCRPATNSTSSLGPYMVFFFLFYNGEWCAGHVKLEAESGASSICGLLSPFTLLKVLHDMRALGSTK